MENSKTLMERLSSGELPEAIVNAVRNEPLDAAGLAEEIIAGRAVLVQNRLRPVERPCAIGNRLRTKVNANIGSSADNYDPQKELMKLAAAADAGADTVMDLSTGGDIDRLRKRVISSSAVPIGTVPVYQAAILARERHGSIVKMTSDELFNSIERHAEDGVDYVTVHCGVTRKAIDALEKAGRIADIVSRGGAFTAGWILYNDRENPLYSEFDRLLDIARRYELTLSLGDGFRPGAVADATDSAQLQELLTLGELVMRCREAGVQAMVEGPGHVPIHMVVDNVRIAKEVCKGAPFYVLGPLVTDVAPGYDHIVASIGGALAASAGADFLCYVTPSEHLGLPEVSDVHEGTVVSRIAAHAADLAKNPRFFMEWDNEISVARKALDWERQLELSIDPARSEKMLRNRRGREEQGCSMCGDLCAMEFIAEYLESGKSSC